MNLYKSFALLLALFALACNFSITAFAAETSKKSNSQTPAKPVKMAAPAKPEERYKATSDFVTLEKAGFTQTKYSVPATLNGLGLKTAAELGLAGKSIYNEYEHSARVVVLAPSAQVYYDTGSLEPLYLAGCLRDGKPFANRIKLCEPLQKAPEPVPTVTPMPKPVAVVTPVPTPPMAQQVLHEPNGTPTEVWYEKPKTVVNKVSAGYDVDFKSAKGDIVVVPAIRLLPTVAVVDVPVPPLSANRRHLNNGDPSGNR